MQVALESSQREGEGNRLHGMVWYGMVWYGMVLYCIEEINKI